METFGHSYQAKKGKLIEAMKSDYSDTWQQRGKRFEVFRPKHENLQPSEWYIPLYALLHPLVVLGFRKPGRVSVHEKNATVNSKRGLFSKVLLTPFMKRKAEEPEKPDEGWVL